MDLDLETQGLDATDPSLGIVALGLAGAEAVLCFDTYEWSPELWATFSEWAKERQLSAFNAAFDFAWLRRLGEIPLYGCSLVLFKMLTTEGFFGQRWTLEAAQEDVLGWPEVNKTWLKESLRAQGLSKSEMWRLGQAEATSRDFLRYCGLDAEAARQLRLTCEAAASPQVLKFWKNEWNNAILLTLEAQAEGLTVNVKQLKANRVKLLEELGAVETKIREDSELAPFIREIEEKRAEGFYKVHCSTRKVVLKPGEEAPEDHVPLWNGTSWYYEQTTVKVPNVGKPRPRVNFKSQPDLTELLWGCLAKGEQVVDLEAKTVAFGGRTVPLTESGALPVNSAAFGCFGETGKLLDTRAELFTRLGFFNAYLEASERDGLIHPSFKLHGTVSGRCAGGSDG